ncbi:hypothetical protein FDECE_11811 [Fusarium decemcellulare]|nr:hypothetical protein FDECE_11811 [Fusarium decemcellulare]
MARLFTALLIYALCISSGIAFEANQPLGQEISTRQTLVAPPPCEPIYPPPSEFETRYRFNCFTHAFLISKNLTEAFRYISKGYIAAFDALAPMWPTVNITFQRKLFQDGTGWLNYNSSAVGEIIDRFRWDAGCIVEHPLHHVLGRQSHNKNALTACTCISRSIREHPVGPQSYVAALKNNTSRKDFYSGILNRTPARFRKTPSSPNLVLVSGASGFCLDTWHYLEPTKSHNL